MGTGTERFRKPVKDEKHFKSEWERLFGKKDEIKTGVLEIDPAIKKVADTLL